MRNPMDGYRDIFPWQYHWSTDWNAHVSQKLAQAEFLWPGIKKWTYNNHLKLHSRTSSLTWRDRVDIYWGDDIGDRDQLPIWAGDQITSWILAQWRPKVEQLLWNGMEYSRRHVDRPWTGSMQGQCVDHIHVEFLP